MEYRWQHVFVFNNSVQTKYVEIKIKSTVQYRVFSSQKIVQDLYPMLTLREP